MDYRAKLERLTREMKSTKDSVQLQKSTSNLFRSRIAESGKKLDMRDFNEIIEVNTTEGWVDVEAVTSYEKLVDECLKHGVMPAVVPELMSITIGGALTGVGIESTSFRHGFVHQAVYEFDVLLSDGSVVTCTPNNEHSDLFFGFPNSYGSLGYVLRVRAKTLPVKKYVHMKHETYEDVKEFFSAMDKACASSEYDFVEGVIFSPSKHVLSVSVFTDEAPYTSDYTYLNIYYKSLLSRTEDYLGVRDYIWRFDTDWFWRSDLLLAQYPLVRRMLGKKRLNSPWYTKMLRRSHTWWGKTLALPFKWRAMETVIQDVEIPVVNAPKFLEFFHREIKMLPIIAGPVRNPDASKAYPLFPLDGRLYVNIGFWNAIPARKGKPKNFLNRLIEEKVTECEGRKMLYSDSYFTKEEFRALYGGDTYDVLKKKYDPTGKLKDLYQKCVLKA